MAVTLNRWRLIGLLVLSSCTAYHPLPLTPEAVEAWLQPPDMTELRILAREIEHPLLPAVELNPDEGLSPDGAAVMAVILNPSLRALRSRKALADAQLLEAGLLPNPELSYSLDVPTGGDTKATVNAFGVELSWDLTALLSRTPRVAEAKAHRAAVALDVAWQEWQTAQAARSAVLQLAVLRSRVSLAEEVLQDLEQNLLQVKTAVAAGAMTISVLATAQTARRQAEENLLDLKKQAGQSSLQLRRLLGLAADSPIRLHRDIARPFPVDLPTDAVLLDGLERRRLDLLALHCGYLSQEAAVRAAIMGQFPRISIGPTLSRDTDNLRTTGFGLSIELPIFNRNQGQIARERATRQALFDEYANRLFEARSDIGLIVSGLRFLNQQLVSARDSVSGLETLAGNYRSALAEGRIDALTYRTARSELAIARMKVLDLQGQLAQTVVALQLATGYYDIPAVGPPAAPPGQGGDRL